MMSGIDPKVDYAFEKVFGSESNTDLSTLREESALPIRMRKLSRQTALRRTDGIVPQSIRLDPGSLGNVRRREFTTA